MTTDISPAGLKGEAFSMEISPTNEFFSADAGALVRAWRGKTNKGSEIIALVAGVQMDEAEANPFKPVPPPIGTWTETVRSVMALVWKMAERLDDKEAMELANWVSSRASYRDPSWIEQRCSREACQKPYHGPAVYCCFECASLDAQ